MGNKKITITADDFGLSTEIDKAIIELCRNKVITRVSVMTNSNRFQETIDELREACPDIDLSIHLNLTDGKPLADLKKIPSLLNNKNELLGGKHYLVAFKLLGNLIKPEEVYIEWSAQIQKALDLNLQINEINSHGHIHLHPKLHKVTLQLAKKFNINRIRLINNTHSFKSCIYHFLSLILVRQMQKEHLFSDFKNSSTIGINAEGKLTTSNIIDKVKNSKKKNIELITHPALPGCLYHTSWGWRIDSDFQTLSNPVIKELL